MRKTTFLFLLLMFCSSAWALEIDEKLTLRIISTSNTKKTISINRGIEDGLKQSDHAKFYVSEGVVARAVCIKLSPTRSVWSVYRVVNANFINNDQVMKLKITPPVKITKDESRMLVEDNEGSNLVKDPRDLGIPLADNADDLAASQVARITSVNVVADSVDLASRNKEVFGMIHYSSDTEKSTQDNNGAEYSQAVDNLFLLAGAEYYFLDKSKWYSMFSLIGSFSLDRRTVMGYQGATVKENTSEFAGGINFHPFKHPSESRSIIYYLSGSIGIGSVTSTYSPGNENVAYKEETLNASVFAYHFGGGFKYYTGEGFGMRAEFSYHVRGDQYGADTSEVTWTKAKSGPKLLVGISYRF